MKNIYIWTFYHPPPHSSSMKKGKFLRIRNKDVSQWNSPPQLVSNFIKFLNIFLVENSHVVQALPPFSSDNRHVLREKKKKRKTAHRLFTAAPSLPAASGLGRVTTNNPPHVRASKASAKKKRKKDGEIKALDCRKVTAVFREGGKVGAFSQQKGDQTDWAMNLHLQGDVTTPGADLSSRSLLSLLFSRAPLFEQPLYLYAIMAI